MTTQQLLDLTRRSPCFKEWGEFLFVDVLVSASMINDGRRLPGTFGQLVSSLVHMLALPCPKVVGGLMIAK